MELLQLEPGNLVSQRAVLFHIHERSQTRWGKQGRRQLYSYMSTRWCKPAGKLK